MKNQIPLKGNAKPFAEAIEKSVRKMSKMDYEYQLWKEAQAQKVARLMQNQDGITSFYEKHIK
jgi:hypothetical protein